MHQAQQGPPLSEGYSYYGSRIPPHPYYDPNQFQLHHHRRSRFPRPLRILIKVFIIFCVLFGIAALILWLVYRPVSMQVAVETATLSRFTLVSTTPASLSFNLSATMRIWNPNSKVGFYYDSVEVDGYYRSQRFGSVPLPAFFQGVRETTTVRPALQGSSDVNDIGGSGVDGFENDNRTGLFEVHMWLYGRVRYKLAWMNTRLYRLRVKCPLRLQLLVAANRTDCVVVDF